MAIKIAGTEVINDNRELVLAKLTEINTSIADTAVDVFVYDTRKDSDGGQWRHRCQHTSWYNETLNTSTRGSRKEFPAVAVIVAESNQVTIYDGDDPNMPMWMVFNGVGSRGSQTAYYLSSGTLTGLSALNGQISVSHYGTVIINMVADSGIYVGSSADNNRGTFTKPIVERNSVQGYTTPVLTAVHYDHNDVAMTVLPNAPIDAATGLPVPTIAVATDGGVSVIKDDGTVVDSSATGSMVSVAFTEANTLFAMNGPTRLRVFNDYNSDGFTHASFASDFGTPVAPQNGVSPVNGSDGNMVGEWGDNLLWGFDSGLSMILADYNALTSTSAIAYVTSDYNTGWMNGDIKLATLSDTDDTNVTGSELVTNGTFDSDTAWTKGTGWTISGGKATHTQSSGGGELYQEFNVVAGNTYVMSFTIDTTGDTSIYNTSIGFRSTGGSYLASISSSNNFGDIAANTASQRFSITYYASSSITVRARIFSDDDLSIDDWSVRLAEEDRSVNGNGLQVFGTVTKSAVSSGADLVAYSGFNGSNWLKLPYQSWMDIGTGDICFMGWIKHSQTDATRVFLSVGNETVNDNRMAMYTLSDGTVRFILRQNSGEEIIASSSGAISDGVWHHVIGLRSNGIGQIYVDGKVSGSSVSSTKSIVQTGTSLKIGVDYNHSGGSANAIYASMALWRASATAPSPEQIKKIYEDEKVLFQEGAQATLYGSSDAVTAMAYDDSTNLLHVGTSAGRSVFQGLRRVDNTTNAVGTAISASNGLVADE